MPVATRTINVSVAARDPHFVMNVARFPNAISNAVSGASNV